MWTALLDVLYPPYCAACDASLQDGDPAPLCATCAEASLEPVPQHACSTCGEVRLGALLHRVCARCFASPPRFSCARAAYLYGGALRDAITKMKFGGREDLCGPLAACLAREALTHVDALGDFAVVAPVPLHPERLAERGFDQATPLARAVARALHRRFARPLRRVRATVPQSRLDAEARVANLRNAFVVVERVRGIGVLLVDDVLTTGATADACAAVLLDAGAARVVVLTLARASTVD